MIKQAGWVFLGLINDKAGRVGILGADQCTSSAGGMRKIKKQEWEGISGTFGKADIIIFAQGP
jgi:hypothetical protein